jgi:uncharacterized integral membrane protein
VSRLTGAVVVLVVLVLVMLFARANGGEQVTLDLGFGRFSGVPLTYIAFGSLFIGMLVMLLAGIHADLRVRRFLRERLADEDREERQAIDRTQQDLFASQNDTEERS